jgi:hypothetical protein
MINPGLRLAVRSRRASAALIAALAAAAAQPATAAIYTYSWESGSSFSFADGVTASPTGEVAVDPKESNFLSDKIILSGSGVEAGTFSPDVFNGSDTLAYVDGSASLELSFVGGLYAGEGAKLVSVMWSSVESGDLRNADKVSGGLQLADSLGATAAPEPSTWLLLGAGAITVVLVKRSRDPRRLRRPFAAHRKRFGGVLRKRFNPINSQGLTPCQPNALALPPPR